MYATTAASMQQRAAPNASFSSIAPAVMAFVVDHFADDITLVHLAAVARESTRAFSRSFVQNTGVEPMRWLWQVRVVLAAELLAIDPRAKLRDVAMICGFANLAHLCRTFSSVYRVGLLCYRKELLAEV